MGDGLIGSAISAGTDLTIAGGNAILQNMTNIKNRQFTREMYNRQRADALSDWNMQNAYNDPSQQMARLKKAGLNPNLVYGNGVQGASGSSAPPRGSSASGGQAQAPQINFSAVGALTSALHNEMAQQQITNLETQNLVLKSQVDKNIAQTSNVSVDTELKRFNLNLDNALRDITLATAQGNLDKIGIGNQVALEANERAAAMNSANLQIAAQKVLELRLANETVPLKRQLIQQEIDAISKNNELRQLTIDLQKKGFNWSDPYWMRVGSTIIDKVLSDPASAQAALDATRMGFGFGFMHPF